MIMNILKYYYILEKWLIWIFFQVKPVDSKADKIQAKLNEQVKSASESQPSTSGYSRGNRNSKGISPRKDESCSTKHLKWDKAVLETLVSISIKLINFICSLYMTKALNSFSV